MIEIDSNFLRQTSRLRPTMGPNRLTNNFCFASQSDQFAFRPSVRITLRAIDATVAARLCTERHTKNVKSDLHGKKCHLGEAVSTGSGPLDVASHFPEEMRRHSVHDAPAECSRAGVSMRKRSSRKRFAAPKPFASSPDEIVVIHRYEEASQPTANNSIISGSGRCLPDKFTAANEEREKRRADV